MSAVQRVVELVGLPGAGKSTLARELAGTSQLVALRPVLRRAAGYWFATEILKLPSTGALWGNEVVLRFYLGRNKANLRKQYAQNPAMIDVVGAWLQQHCKADAVSSLRFLEHIDTFFGLVSRTYLLNNYAHTNDKVILVDEYWIQYLSFMLNWGEEEIWWDFVLSVLEHISLPDKIIWLKGVAQISEERQTKRNKTATLFYGCNDISRKGKELEGRSLRLEDELIRRGVKVVAIKADTDFMAVKKNVIAAL